MAEQAPKPSPMLVEYTNHAGETELRRLLPLDAPYFGTTRWHPKPGWLLRAQDVDKLDGEGKPVERDFSLSDMYPVHRSGLDRITALGKLETAITSLASAATKAAVSLAVHGNQYRADSLDLAIRSSLEIVAQISPDLLVEARRRVAPRIPVPKATPERAETLEERTAAIPPEIAELIARCAAHVCSDAAMPHSSMEARTFREAWLKVLDAHGMDERSVRHAAAGIHSDDIRRLAQGEI